MTLLTSGMFVVGTNTFVIAGLLPSIAADHGVPESSVRYTITVYGVVVAIASPLIAVFLGRVSRTGLIAGAMAAIATGTLLAAFATTIELFTIGRVLTALGSAALVPTATAAATALVAPSRRGWALATVGLGFTFASAIGSPFGIALAAVGGWRLPLIVLGGCAVVLTLGVFLFLRGFPTPRSLAFSRRIGVLRDARVLFALGAMLSMSVATYSVYFLSAQVTSGVTGGSVARLAELLLVYGIAGVGGTMAAGPLTDRLGSRPVYTATVGVAVVTFATLPALTTSYVGTAVAFGVWGVVGAAATVPMRHRLVAIDPAQAEVSLSWFSTAMYLAISLAPLIGTAALSGGSAGVFIAAAVASLIALIAFTLGFVPRTKGSWPEAA